MPDKSEMSEDARAALALMPKVKKVMGTVRGMLPPGTQFGVYVWVPGEKEGRLIAMNTDADFMTPIVAQWVLDRLGRPRWPTG
jgi:hypothetical protein